MSYHTFVSIAVVIALAIALGSALVKTTSRQFAHDPAKPAYQGSSVREQSSERAENTAERQRRMMEDLKSRIERNKH